METSAPPLLEPKEANDFQRALTRAEAVPGGSAGFKRQERVLTFSLREVTEEAKELKIKASEQQLKAKRNKTQAKSRQTVS